MATNTYTVNEGTVRPIDGESAEIDMSEETGVKAGCRDYPIPLLNKITVTSAEGALSKTSSIYAGYKVVQQLLGAIVRNGNYNINNPNLNTIISTGKFGMFEPAHYYTTGRWSNHGMDSRQIDSLINVGTGVKICVEIKYTKSNNSPAVEYVPIHGASANFSEHPEKAVSPYANIGGSALPVNETVVSGDIEVPQTRTWFESVLNANSLNVDLSAYIIDPNTTQNIRVTLMAYIGSPPTENNTFKILPMDSLSITSFTCQFETYNPTINIANKDEYNNYDTYDDKYGSVAEYDEGTDDDTTIKISIIPSE